MILTYTLIIDTDTCEFVVKDADSGNSQTVSLPIKKTRKQTVVVDDNPIPTLNLSTSKFSLNKAAVELLNAEPGDRLSVVFDAIGRPILGKNEALGIGGGNKLTNSFTVSYRGNNNEELAKHGSIFKLEPKPETEGICYLIGDNEPEDLKLDENLTIPASGGISDIPDINIEDVLNNIEDESNYEMSGFDFSF